MDISNRFLDYNISFDNFCSYYFQPLRRALTKMGASAPLLQSLIPDTQDNSLSFSVLNYLKRLKNQAKIEFEKLCADVINKASSSNIQKVYPNCNYYIP